MSGGKGQITLFVIVGLVLLLVVAIAVMFLHKRAPESQNPVIADRRLLDNYVIGCLNTVVTDEFTKLGRSGGLSAADAAMYPHATVRVDGIETPVLYGITRNRRGPGAIIPPAANPPAYPAPGVTFATVAQYWNGTDMLEIPEFSDGYFGEVNFPAICDKDGPNGAGSTVLCKYYPGIPPGTVAPAAQGVLKEHIERRLPECVSIRQFEEAVGQQVTALSAPNVSLKFTRSAVLVRLDYPLTIEGRSTTLPFEQSYTIRYLALGEYATDLARQETRDISFDIADRTQYANKALLPSYEEGFEVTRTASVPLAGVHAPAEALYGADLITITDTRSSINGKPLRFSFLVEHRPPMLDESLGACTPDAGKDPDDLPVLATITLTECTISDADLEQDRTV